MSLTSGYSLERWNKPLAFVVAFVETGLFCLICVSCFLGVAVACNAIAQASAKAKATASAAATTQAATTQPATAQAGTSQADTWTNPWKWMKAPQFRPHVLKGLGQLLFMLFVALIVGLPYLVFLVVYWLPGRAAPAETDSAEPGPFTCFAKAAIFAIISAAFFPVPMLVYVAIARTAAPVWMYLSLGGAYLLVILFYWSRVRIAGIQVEEEVSVGLIVKIILFCAASAAYFLSAALVYAAIAQALGQEKLEPFFHPGAWFAALPVWMYVLTIGGYIVAVGMYAVYVAGADVPRLVRTLLLPLAPFAKTVYFCAVTAAYLLGSGVLCALIARAMYRPDPAPDVMALLGAVPAWMYAVLAVGYVALITIYWAPGREEISRVEMLGFATFLAVLLLTLAATYRKQIALSWFGMQPADAEHHLGGRSVLTLLLWWARVIPIVIAAGAGLVVSHGAALWAGALLVGRSRQATFGRSIPAGVLVAVGGTIVGLVAYFLAAMLGMTGQYTAVAAAVIGVAGGLLVAWWIIHDLFEISVLRAVLACLPMLAWDAVAAGIIFAVLSMVRG